MKKKERIYNIHGINNGYNFAILKLYPLFLVQITYIERIAKERQSSIGLLNLSVKVLNYSLHEKKKGTDASALITTFLFECTEQPGL